MADSRDKILAEVQAASADMIEAIRLFEAHAREYGVANARGRDQAEAKMYLDTAREALKEAIMYYNTKSITYETVF